MTIVLINAISIKTGGGLVVLRELLAVMTKLRPYWQWHIVLNSQIHPGQIDTTMVCVHTYPEVDQSGWKTRLWYEFGLIDLINKIGCDILFSETNYLPVRKIACQTILLVQHAGHFSAEFTTLMDAGSSLLGKLIWRLKGHWVRTSIRSANAVVVQTQALADLMRSKIGNSTLIQVIPHGPGLVGLREEPVLPPDSGITLRIGYITKWGVQKNFDVLFASAAYLRASGLDFILVLTLTREFKPNDEIFRVARYYGVEDLIENHGELAFENLPALYDSLHLFVFPSLCESFGFPMVEAMSRGIPLLVADVNSNLEVSANGALSFPRYDAKALAVLIHTMVVQPGAYVTQSCVGLIRARQFCWEQSAICTIDVMESIL